MRGETLRIGEGESGATNGALPGAKDVEVRDITDAFALAKPDTEALNTH
jgi:hypothetical protein